MDETSGMTRLSPGAGLVMATAGTLAAAVGIVPYALAAGYSWVFWAGCGVAFVVSLATAAGYERAPNVPSRPLRIPWGVWRAVTFGALLSVCCLLFSMAAEWVWRVVGWMTEGLDWALPGTPEGVGFGVSLVVFFVFGVVMFSGGTLVFAEDVFPQTWAKLAEGSQIPRPGVLLATAGGGVVLLVLILWFAEPGSPWRVGLLTIWLVTFTFPLLADEGATTDELRTVQTIAELVEAAGYSAERNLRSGRPEIDSLLAEVDLVAVGPQHAVVVQVLWNRRSKPVEWFEASHLRTATWAIQEWKQGEGREVLVEPMLVLVDCEVADSLERFLQDEDFAVARLSGQDLEEVDAADPPRRRELAQQLLDLRPVAFAKPREEGRS